MVWFIGINKNKKLNTHAELSAFRRESSRDKPQARSSHAAY
jgi:hypothetical protein